MTLRQVRPVRWVLMRIFEDYKPTVRILDRPFRVYSGFYRRTWSPMRGQRVSMPIQCTTSGPTISAHVITHMKRATITAALPRSFARRDSS
ncbi:hypothetical protein LMG29542_07199 [Paraburkholderia humisilvae]|uniref:Uncharacterized protein n=1 Tax=Paraburkholderia humisilvae TaxID=627669 RepID=A0A6J5F4H7_9BURK|nr:hypothetical protein LMG29542_07199 [Paraburkholderia humisilvae]